MEIKELTYSLYAGDRLNGSCKPEFFYLDTKYGDNTTRSTITEEQLIKFLEHPFHHFKIQSIDPFVIPFVFDNLVCFSKMQMVNYLILYRMDRCRPFSI
jgi:hypothetical protein